MESLSNMDSAGSCDSVISVNSGCVSAAVDLISVTFPTDCVLYDTTYKEHDFLTVLYCLVAKRRNKELRFAYQVVMTCAWAFTVNM